MSERVLILGMARSGRAAARLLRGRGRRVLLSDLRLAQEDLPEDLRDLPFLGGEFREEWLDEADTLLLSPGIPLDAAPAKAARERGLRVTGELEEAFRLADAPVLAVTGTNGKSTTTTLAGLLLEASGLVAPAGGNLGRPFSELVRQVPGAEVYVVEVSSFQAETFERFAPLSAGLLNLTPDHLDRYGELESYFAAKLRCFAAMGPQDALVLPSDPAVEARLEGHPSRRLLFATEPVEGEGAFLREEVLHTRWEGREEALLPAEELGMLGRHNLSNALAALALCLPFGLDGPAAAGALRRFTGLPHRMEYLGETRGLRCYNDSKATNVEAALASLSGLDQSLLLIAGGRDKGGDFRLLADGLPQVRRVYAIGEATALVCEAFGERAVPCGDLEGALARAREEGRPGEWLVLSPACASYDQFADFEARGRRFAELLKEGA